MAQLSGPLGKKFDVGTMHVCTRTCSVFTELSLGGKTACHALTFNDEGDVSAARLFTAV